MFLFFLLGSNPFLAYAVSWGEERETESSMNIYHNIHMCGIK